MKHEDSHQCHWCTKRGVKMENLVVEGYRTDNFVWVCEEHRAGKI